MGALSLWHWIALIVVALLLFGRGKISELMGDVAQGIKAFKKGMAEDVPDTKAERQIESASGDPVKPVVDEAKSRAS